MAVFISTPKLLEFTPPSGVSATSLDLLTEASFSESKQVEEIMTGNSRHPFLFVGGREDVKLTVSSIDFDKYDDFKVGGVYSDLELTAEGYSCAGGSTAGTITASMSKGMLTEKGEVSLNAEGNTPASYSLTFTMTKLCSDNTNPTFTVSASGVA